VPNYNSLHANAQSINSRRHVFAFDIEEFIFEKLLQKKLSLVPGRDIPASRRYRCGAANGGLYLSIN
jgi:hypothetical protein